MSENLKWFQDKTAAIWAGIWAVGAIVIYEGLKTIIEKSEVFLNEHPNIKEFVDWFFFLIPWIVLSVITFLFIRQRTKANILNASLTEN